MTWHWQKPPQGVQIICGHGGDYKASTFFQLWMRKARHSIILKMTVCPNTASFKMKFTPSPEEILTQHKNETSCFSKFVSKSLARHFGFRGDKKPKQNKMNGSKLNAGKKMPERGLKINAIMLIHSWRLKTLFTQTYWLEEGRRESTHAGCQARCLASTLCIQG